MPLYRSGVALGLVDPVSLAQYRLALASTDQVRDEIETAIAADDYAYAGSLYQLAIHEGHHLPMDLGERAEGTLLRRAFVTGSGVANGFVFGSIDNGAEIAGSVSSDLVGFGDLRDFSVQGIRLAAGGDYDPVLLTLSVIGLGLTAATYGTAGAAGLADAGFAVVKNVRRAGKMSRPFAAYLAKTAGQVIDTKRLRREIASAVDEGALGLSRARAIAARVVDRKAAGALVDDARVLGEIGTAGGPRAAVQALSLAEGPSDLRRLQRIGLHFGDRSTAVMKFLGRSLMTIGWDLYLLVAALAGLAASLALFCLRQAARLLLFPCRRQLKPVFKLVSVI
ncbi:hypothetical protein [Rhizobium sp. SL42]|uniref:hypothetical protein n=1 Tax=Rhizobium sp. SL42 TaxID=2806346 RepID=UPI001F404458|nr:hypothetical protein [Rhizobium sp. SL42]UJW73310.1 hypothetical protein IM739_10210 [Rhizobium sp. SL42]